MYGGYGMNMMQGQGMMQPMQLEIPLKEGAGQVNLMTVYPGKVVLRSRADYENLWKHLSSYREANQFAKEEDYQEFVSATYYGMPKNMGMGDWTGSFQDGKHPYWWGEGVKPMYQHKNVDPISKELLDRKQIDETIVYAPQGTYNKLSQNQSTFEDEARSRMEEFEKRGIDTNTKNQLVANSKPTHELEAKFFEQARYLFSADSNGTVKQLSLRQGEVVNDYGNKFHNKTIYAMTSTKNSKYIFTGDEAGNLRQISVVDGEVVKDYGKIFKATVTSMTTSPDSRYLLCGDENGNIKQYDCQLRTMVREFKKALPGAALTIAVSPDSESFFTAGSQGHCKQFNINTGEVIRDFKKVHKGSIFSICVSADANYLFTSDKYGYVKQYSVKDGLLVKDYGKTHERFIYAMSTSGDAKWLFVTGNRGCMKQFDIKKQECHKDFGRVHEADSDICALIVGPNSQFMWSSDDAGNVKEWNCQTGELLREFNGLHNGRIHGLACVH